MQKVIVIGSPGAGKSTFSRKLREVKLKDILMRDQWILDGNHGLRQNLTRSLSNLSLTFPKKVYLEYMS